MAKICSNAELDARFIKATKKFRLVDAEEFLNSGANIDAVDRKGMTALIYAARGGNLRVVQFLVELGAALDVQDHAGYTAAMYSAYHRRPKVAEYLAHSGANLILKNNRGQNAYDIAMGKGYKDVATIFPEIDLTADLKRGTDALSRLRRGIRPSRINAT